MQILNFRIIILFVSLLSASQSVYSADSVKPVFRAEEIKEAKDARMKWWRDAKFGMFVHWGIYAAAEGKWKGVEYPDMRPGIEWLLCKGGVGPSDGGIPLEEYTNTLAPKMTLANFNPQEWAELAKTAGMRYFVITAKHHDGFGMVDFPDTDYDIAGKTPYGADPSLLLAKSMLKAGLKFGFYFSQSQDWSKPGGRPKWFKGLEGDWTKYVYEHAVPQLKHLLSGHYGDIDLLWFDSGTASKTKEGADAIWAELTSQPQIIVNNRLKQGYNGDFSTPEQWIPAKIQDDIDWETCMTMNGSWGYNPTDPHWKSSDELIKKLCKVVARGGNFLLNVGPKADGSWEPQVAEILRYIGAWMKINNDAIYGTEANPLGILRWGELTWKKDANGVKLFALITNWPANSEILLPLKNKPLSMKWLAEQSSDIQYSRVNDGVLIKLNRTTPLHSAVSVIEIKLDSKPQAQPLVIQAEDDHSFTLKAQEADVQKGKSGISLHWRYPYLSGWESNKKDSKANWEIRVKNSNKYRVEIEYAYNHPDPSLVKNQSFTATIGNQTIKFPLQITGTEVDSHNKEVNNPKVQTQKSDEMIQLSEGKYKLEITAQGTPTKLLKFTSREDKKIKCYSNFAYLKSVKLVPIKPN